MSGISTFRAYFYCTIRSSDPGEAYKDAINEAGVLAREGNLVTFGMPVRTADTRYGYICCDGIKWKNSWRSRMGSRRRNTCRIPDI